MFKPTNVAPCSLSCCRTPQVRTQRPRSRPSRCVRGGRLAEAPLRTRPFQTAARRVRGKLQSMCGIVGVCALDVFSLPSRMVRHNKGECFYASYAEACCCWTVGGQPCLKPRNRQGGHKSKFSRGSAPSTPCPYCTIANSGHSSSAGELVSVCVPNLQMMNYHYQWKLVSRPVEMTYFYQQSALRQMVTWSQATSFGELLTNQPAQRCHFGGVLLLFLGIKICWTLPHSTRTCSPDVLDLDRTAVRSMWRAAKA